MEKILREKKSLNVKLYILQIHVEQVIFMFFCMI